jgi:hypothetical protein
MKSLHMRTKLLGIFLVVLGLFLASQTHWRTGPVIGGCILAFIGALLLSGAPTARRLRAPRVRQRSRSTSRRNPVIGSQA